MAQILMYWQLNNFCEANLSVTAALIPFLYAQESRSSLSS